MNPTDVTAWAVACIIVCVAVAVAAFAYGAIKAFVFNKEKSSKRIDLRERR